MFGNAASAALKSASAGEAGNASEAGGIPAAAPAAAQLFGNVKKTSQPPEAKLPETMGQLLIASVVEQLFLDVFPVPLPSTDAVVRRKVKAFRKKRQRSVSFEIATDCVFSVQCVQCSVAAPMTES